MTPEKIKKIGYIASMCKRGELIPSRKLRQLLKMDADDVLNKKI